MYLLPLERLRAEKADRPCVLFNILSHPHPASGVSHHPRLPEVQVSSTCNQPCPAVFNLLSVTLTFHLTGLVLSTGRRYGLMGCGNPILRLDGFHPVDLSLPGGTDSRQICRKNAGCQPARAPASGGNAVSNSDKPSSFSAPLRFDQICCFHW